MEIAIAVHPALRKCSKPSAPIAAKSVKCLSNPPATGLCIAVIAIRSISVKADQHRNNPRETGTLKALQKTSTGLTPVEVF
jgi:hypothetical protein